MVMTSIQVDPNKVIERLSVENAKLLQAKIFLEIAYEQLQGELDEATLENRRLQQSSGALASSKE